MNNIVNQQPASLNARTCDSCQKDYQNKQKDYQKKVECMGKSCCLLGCWLGGYLSWGDGLLLSFIGIGGWALAGRMIGERSCLPAPAQVCSHYAPEQTANHRDAGVSWIGDSGNLQQGTRSALEKKTA